MRPIMARTEERTCQRRRAGWMCASALTVLLLAANCISFYGSRPDYWASPVLLVLLLFAMLALNCLLIPGRGFSLASLFLLVLFVCHAGYYIPVHWKLAPPAKHMPPVNGFAAVTAMTVFVGALVALELGYLVGVAMAKGRKREVAASVAHQWSMTTLCAGVAICILSVCSLMVFWVQVGGPLMMLRMSYSEFFHFIDTGDARFALSALWYAPIGLLLCVAGRTAYEGSMSPILRRLWYLVACVLLAPFLAIGARGPSFLLIVGCIYLTSQGLHRARVTRALGVAACLLLIAPLFVSYRNLQLEERGLGLQQARLGIMNGVLEAGSVYRPYYGIVELMESGQQEYLHGKSYLSAASDVLPNLGEPSSERPGTYYRTNSWFNYRLAPLEDTMGVGIGCSIIAEQFANFGYIGVVVAFVLLGSAIAFLEVAAWEQDSEFAKALLAILIVPLCWYVRDDIFGCMRLFVWPLGLLLLVHFLRRPIRLRAPADVGGSGI